MKSNLAGRLYGKANLYLKRNSSTILTILGGTGVLATTVSTAFATSKIKDQISETENKGDVSTKERMIIAVQNYIPTAALCTSTLICIFGANALNKKQQAALASAYALIEQSFREYKNKLIELHGEEADKEVRTAIVQEHADYHVIDSDIPEGKIEFYDEISGNSILLYEREVIDAEYHLNRNYVLRGYATLNEFYEFLGLPKTDYGAVAGWNMDSGIEWLDFEHEMIPCDDSGPDICAISFVFDPDVNFLEEYYD